MKETLEEVSKRIFPKHKRSDFVSLNKIMLRRAAWIKGVKWQVENDKKCYHPLPYRLAKSDINFECTLCF